jgi:succinate dehydrogenase/fumarate reductase cytochrome b subunit
MKIYGQMNFIHTLFIVVLVLSPFIASATAYNGFDELVMNIVVPFLNSLIVLGVSVAFFFFLWGLAKFIWALSEGSEDSMDTGKQLMIWGTVAIFVLVSLWGILVLMSQILGFSDGVLFVPQFGSLQ